MIFAYIFNALMIAIIIFQLALALGAPFGDFTMGGKYPGRLPTKMRIVALIQILILLLFGSIVISRAGIALERFYNVAVIGIWFIVAFFILGSIVNLASPSKKEKLIMGPINVIALLCSLIVAII